MGGPISMERSAVNVTARGHFSERATNATCSQSGSKDAATECATFKSWPLTWQNAERETRPMGDWVRIYRTYEPPVWGFKLQSGMRMKDLPDNLRTAGVPHEGALHPFEFSNGKFFAVEWIAQPKGPWPIKKLIPLEAGDYLIEECDFGISFARPNRRF